MNTKTKKILIVVVGFVLLCALAFAIAWPATDHMRFRNKEISKIKAGISDYRSGKSSLDFRMPYTLTEDAKFAEFLLTQTQEMCENDESKLLCEFLKILANREYHSSAITEAVNEYILSVNSVDEALELGLILQQFDKSASLNRYYGVMASYIKEKGVNPITTIHGKGYYADKKDSYSKETIGLSNSPLYRAERVTYKGDFEYIKVWGVRLDDYYQEESYSSSSLYFRGKRLSSLPDLNSCVWSGDYLFVFSTGGELLECVNVD